MLEKCRRKITVLASKMADFYIFYLQRQKAKSRFYFLNSQYMIQPMESVLVSLFQHTPTLTVFYVIAAEHSYISELNICKAEENHYLKNEIEKLKHSHNKAYPLSRKKQHSKEMDIQNQCSKYRNTKYETFQLIQANLLVRSYDFPPIENVTREECPTSTLSPLTHIPMLTERYITALLSCDTSIHVYISE